MADPARRPTVVVSRVVVIVDVIVIRFCLRVARRFSQWGQKLGRRDPFITIQLIVRYSEKQTKSLEALEVKVWQGNETKY
jgi:hypothetical protein